MASPLESTRRQGPQEQLHVSPESARVLGAPLRVPASYGAVPRAVHDALVFTLREQLEIFMNLLASAAQGPSGTGSAGGSADDGGRQQDARLRGHRVLIVDDDHVQAGILARRLGATGFDAALVEIAASGIDAIVAATERPFLLVFVDYRMPGLDGVETTARLRRIRPDTPIVGCSSDYSRDLRTKFLAAGADDCLAKPVSQPLLDAVVLRWLSEQDDRQRPSHPDRAAARTS